MWAVGTAGYFISYHIDVWDIAPDVPDPSNLQSEETLAAALGMALGYFSALCYIFARIPQIIKNYREQSCKGKFGVLPPTRRYKAASLLTVYQGSLCSSSCSP